MLIDALLSGDLETARSYMGRYKQHDPYVADGPEGLLGSPGDAPRVDAPDCQGVGPEGCAGPPFASVEFPRIWMDGDFVILMGHFTWTRPFTTHRGATPVNEGIGFDVFRVIDGKIDEHWDSAADVPLSSLNDNTPF